MLLLRFGFVALWLWCTAASDATNATEEYNAHSPPANVRDLTQALWLDRFIAEAFPDTTRKAQRSRSSSAAIDAVLNAPLDALLSPTWRKAFAEVIPTAAPVGSDANNSPPSFIDVVMRDDMASVRTLAQETIVTAIGLSPSWFATFSSNNTNAMPDDANGARSGGTILPFVASLGVCCLAINWMMRQQIQRTLVHVLIGMGAGGALFALLLFAFASNDTFRGDRAFATYDDMGGDVDEDTFAWDGGDVPNNARRRRWKRKNASDATPLTPSNALDLDRGFEDFR